MLLADSELQATKNKNFTVDGNQVRTSYEVHIYEALNSERRAFAEFSFRPNHQFDSIGVLREAPHTSISLNERAKRIASVHTVDAIHCRAYRRQRGVEQVRRSSPTN